MDGISMQDYLKNKGEAALFTELLRHLPTVQVEDYYKNGRWQNDLMKLDIEIVEAHRREAGAPEPLDPSEIPRFEVPMPPRPPLAVRPPPALAPLRPISLSTAVSITGTTTGAVPKAPPGAAAGVGAGALWKAPGQRPAVTVPPPPTAPGASAAATAPSEAAPPASWGPADLQQLAVFAAKWQVDAARARALLAPLVPERRRFVLESFEFKPANGGSATAKLEEYIAECQRTGAWGSASGAGAASSRASPASEAAGAPAPGAAAGGAGVKRGLEAAAGEVAEEPAKRQALGTNGVEAAAPRLVPPRLVT